MDSQSKPDVQDLPKEDMKNPSTRMPDMPRDDDAAFDSDKSVGDEEPGPYDDDGLPENARRRVPS